MIFTPQERRALLTLIVLLVLGQAAALWREHRRARPDRALTAWLNRLEAVRADTVIAPGANDPTDSLSAPVASTEATPAATTSADAGPVAEPIDSIPPGLLETGRLQINRASIRDLEALPCIGPTMARRIAEERDRGGPFLRPEDLLRVKGIGTKTLAKLRPHIDWAPR